MADPVPWLDEREQRTWRLFIGASAKLVDRLDADLRSHAGMDLADYEILAFLSEADGGRLRMSDLADAANVSRSRLTHRVNRLEAKGLVRRTPCPQDKRGFYAVLTAKGRRSVDAAAPGHVVAVRKFFTDAIGQSDTDELASALQGILDTLDK